MCVLSVGSSRAVGSTQPANRMSTEDYYQNENSRREHEHTFESSTDFKNKSRVPPLFGLKRNKVTEECRKIHNEEINDLYCSPNIVLVIKSRRMRVGGSCSTCGGEESCVQGFGGET